MSTEEDTELRDLVAQTLEINGCLPKIRAELRASIFLALDEDENVQKKEPLLNGKLKTQLNTREGQIMFCVVREFLEFFNLDYTISVYEPESYSGINYQYEGRSKLIEELGIAQLKDDSCGLGSGSPLLLQLIKIAQSMENVAQKTKNIDINLSRIQNKTMDDTEDNDLEVHRNLNETFNVFLPSIVNRDNNKSPVINNNEEKDDTYDGTSSIAEDIPLNDMDKSVQNSERSHSSHSETEFSPPILKDSKSHSKFDTSFDKLKRSPQKSEKIKAKTSLSSLADLPPLQLNKSRNDTVLLPSLYSKEFKEKTNNQNLKELDKFFDMDVDPLDNYEEDFMSESELNLNNNNNKNSLRDELQSSQSINNSTDSNNKNVSLKNQNLDNIKKNKTEANHSINQNADNNDSNSSTSAASDENVDYALNSPTSN